MSSLDHSQARGEGMNRVAIRIVRYTNFISMINIIRVKMKLHVNVVGGETELNTVVKI